jgi:hypothetical protein
MPDLLACSIEPAAEDRSTRLRQQMASAVETREGSPTVVLDLRCDR